jgi:hypothetical protein
MVSFDVLARGAKHWPWIGQYKFRIHQPETKQSQLGEFSGLGCCDKLCSIKSLLALLGRRPGEIAEESPARGDFQSWGGGASHVYLG